MISSRIVSAVRAYRLRSRGLKNLAVAPRAPLADACAAFSLKRFDSASRIRIAASTKPRIGNPVIHVLRALLRHHRAAVPHQPQMLRGVGDGDPGMLGDLGTVFASRCSAQKIRIRVACAKVAKKSPSSSHDASLMACFHGGSSSFALCVFAQVAQPTVQCGAARPCPVGDRGHEFARRSAKSSLRSRWSPSSPTSCWSRWSRESRPARRSMAR